MHAYLMCTCLTLKQKKAGRTQIRLPPQAAAVCDLTCEIFSIPTRVLPLLDELLLSLIWKRFTTSELSQAQELSMSTFPSHHADAWMLMAPHTCALSHYYLGIVTWFQLNCTHLWAPATWRFNFLLHHTNLGTNGDFISRLQIIIT